MAKKALLDVLEQTIGKYVRNLDAESLNVAVWSGQIELSGLQLDAAAVNAALPAVLPLRVVTGSLAQVQVSVPWAQLMSRSVVMRLRGLEVVVEPCADPMEPEEESRETSLQRAEEYRRQSNALRDLAAPSDASAATNDSFAGRLLRRILENLQIEIADVSVVLRTPGAVCGVTLEALSLVTTDRTGQQTFVDRTASNNDPSSSSFLYKVLRIAGLGIYVDADTRRLQHTLPTIGETDDTVNQQQPHAYVLVPLSWEAQLRQADSNVCLDQPKYWLSSEISELAVRLTKAQYESAYQCMEPILIQPHASSRPLFPEYRPRQRVTRDTARLWWHYAVRCLGRLSGRRSWLEFFRAFQRRKQYIPLYKRFAHGDSSPWLVALLPWEVAAMREIEMDRSISVEGIMAWRNSADAQVRKEQEKHAAVAAQAAPTSLFASLFGTSTATSSNIEAPPIALTTEELQALESSVAADLELSSDSRLCDVRFVLGALRIDIFTDNRPLSALEMGQVATSVQANQDGSYAFDLSLTSLDVHDRWTLHTLFPTILTNPQESEPQFLHLACARSPQGDQKLSLTLKTLEAVASPSWLVQLRHFVTRSSDRSMTTSNNNNNPLLAQSLSGSIDLFYDATQGSVPKDPASREVHSAAPVASAPVGAMEDWSHTLVAAWQAKGETQAAWVIDLDISAPIVVVPESCLNPRANVLVFDLGHFCLQYGTPAAPPVAQWFQDHRLAERRVVLQMEHGAIRIRSLTFSLGRANYWRRMVRKHEAHNRLEEDDEDIIEPISVSVDFGIESILDHAPRVCAVGVVPSVSLRWSPNQLNRVMHVVKAWKLTLKEVIPDTDADVELKEDPVDAIPSPFRRASNTISDDVAVPLPAIIAANPGVAVPLPVLYAEIRLQRLSIRVLDEGENGLEAHLVSVSLSTVNYDNGSSNSSLSMGWFWIMDRFDYDFPRQQRLVAHSTLPMGKEDVSDSSLDILELLKQQGVFEDNYEGSGDLAKISFYQATAGTNFGMLDPFSVEDYEVGMDLAIASKLDAHFSRLFIHWNPRAVKTMMTMVNTLIESFGSIELEHDHQLIVSSPSQLTRRRRFSFDSMTKHSKVESSSSILVTASMDGLQVALNSALDDLPLFTGTMSSTRLSFVSTSESSSRLALSVGDLRVDSASSGSTHSSYRTILGLATGQSDALLSVRYYTGSKALAYSSAFTNLGSSDTESFGEIDLSPMKMVYIQAQVLAIVEYATAGILGVLTANAAATAAQAATEIAALNDSAKKIIVRASSLELVLPRAAYLTDHISASIGSLFVDFSMKPDSSDVATVSVREFLMMSASFGSLLEDPVQMDVSVMLPPEAVGSKDDQAFKVGIAISKANFIISKPQYVQLLSTLDENIGDQDLYLRENSTPLSQVADNDILSDRDELPAIFTHAGTEVVDDPRRIFLSFTLDILALSLCSSSQDEPLLRLFAKNASIDLKLLGDINKITALVSLKDLTCDDERLRTFSRQYRSLIYQTNSHEDVELDDKAFSASYETSDNITSVELKIGSPRIVFIPDVVSDLLEFLSVDRRSPSDTQVVTTGVSYQEVIAVNADDAEISGIEANFVREIKGSVSSFSLSLKTSQCSLLLVDLGSESLVHQGGFSLPSASVAETVVLSGIFDVNASLDTDTETNKLTKIQSQLHGNHIEVYTAFGRELASAVQVLDPTEFALYVTFSSLDGNSQKLDIRCAALSPIDVTLSMQNVALVNAIMNSVTDCFDVSDSVYDDKLHSLNEQEANRLKQLAHALETDSIDASVHSQASSKVVNAGSDSLVQPLNGTDLLSETSFKLTTPECKFSLINDLQGLDEALIRVNFRNIVANGCIQNGECNETGSPPFTGFSFSFHTSVLSDYFDSSTSNWKVLLLQPWEISAKGDRGTSRRFESSRPSTTIDIDSLPCHLSFSEQFLMSLASANRMWSVYSLASESALNSADQVSQKTLSLRRSMVASAARTFISSLPYAVENHCGMRIELQINDDVDKKRRFCESGAIEYFRFDPPVSKGCTGGKRLYGQDVSFEKKISLIVGSHCINLNHLDSLVGLPKATHRLGSDGFIVTDVIKEGKSIVVHLSSGIDIYNRTSIPFKIAVFKDGDAFDVGTCKGQHLRSAGAGSSKGKASKQSRRFGVPLGLVSQFRSDFDQRKDAMIALSFSPQIYFGQHDWELVGGTKLRMNGNSFSLANSSMDRFEITCRPVNPKNPTDLDAPRDLSSFVFQAIVSMMLVDGKDPFIEVAIEPRSFLTNKIPVKIDVKTPMPHVFSSLQRDLVYGDDLIHSIESGESLEIFSPGPSIAVVLKISDLPVGGTSTDWISGGWIDLPLIPEFRMREPLECSFPFVQKSMDPLSLSRSKGIDFFITQGSTSLENLSFSNKKSGSSSTSDSIELLSPPSLNEDWLNFFVTVHSYAIDHTGDLLFEQLVPSSGATFHRSSTGIESHRTSISALQSPPTSAFSSHNYKGRVSLLPHSDVEIRLLHLSMDGDDGLRKSSPFRIDDISICDGGIDSTPVKWEDSTLSGFYTYRQLITSYQSEIHVIPEYIIFNGSKNHAVSIRQPSGVEAFINAGGVAPIRRQGRETASIKLEYPELGAFSNPLRIDALGLRVAILMSRNGLIVGSVALQNVVGDRNSRFVVKIGEVNSGSLAERLNSSSPYVMLRDDYFRFRIKWSELKMTLNEARPLSESKQAFIENALDHLQKVSTPVKSEKTAMLSPTSTWVESRENYINQKKEAQQDDSEKPVCTILFARFTVDWQRVFKDEGPNRLKSERDTVESSERSQFAMVIHSVEIRDETVGSAFPVVFDSTSQLASFFDLCVRFRGQGNSELVVIDLFDLNLSHVNGVSEKMYLNTDEDFVWKVLDLADRILVAAAEFAGVDVQLHWDDEQDGYVVAITEKTSYSSELAEYTPPRSDTIYHIKKTRVSPFKIVVSFKRNPQSSRYKLYRGVKGANIMNYFTRRLKFKIDKAELAFSQFEVSDVKGPPDRFIELITTVYLSKMKSKVVTIMTAASFQDWKFLASREGGDDAYKEGDIMRATGNIAGTTADFVFKGAGQGIGTGVSTVASSLGDGIEAATSAIGVRSLGAGVNSLVTGVGDGVGDTISGVGTGAGKVLKSVGQGAGQAFGGVAGGVMLVGKGLGKGLTKGDGRALASGLIQGGAAVGSGVGQGLESVATGTVEGVMNVGQGLFSGVRNVGRGIGGAFTECCSCFSCCMDGEESRRSGAMSPLLPPSENAEES